MTDENGFKYDFGNKNGLNNPNIVEHTDLSVSMGNQETAWPLNTIHSPYGNSIYFDYEMHEYTNTRYRKDNNLKYRSITVIPAIHREYPGGSEHPIESRWDIEIDPDDNFIFTTTSPYLIRIKGIKEEIEFIRTTRNGGLNSPTLISEIKVYDNRRKLIKKISFTYTNMSSSSPVNITTNTSPWHTVLSSVAIGDGVGIEKEYKFDYYAPPNSRLGSPDYWNYYVFGRGMGSDQGFYLILLLISHLGLM